MKTNLEQSQCIKLLKETLMVFEAELSTSKDFADSKLVQRWASSKVLKQERSRLRDFYDEFCIEISLVCVPLEVLVSHVSDSSELWKIIQPLMGLLESLVTGRLNPSKPSKFAYPRLRALRSKVKESRKRGETISALDRQNNGLLEFKVDPWDHDVSLKILRRCRKKVAELVDLDSWSASVSHGVNQATQQLQGSASLDLLMDWIDWLEEYIFPAFRLCVATTDRNKADHFVLLPLTTRAMLERVLLLSRHESGFVHVDVDRYGFVLQIQFDALKSRRQSLANATLLKGHGAGLCHYLSEHPSRRICLARPALDSDQDPYNMLLWAATNGQASSPNAEFISVRALVGTGHVLAEKAKLSLMSLVARWLFTLPPSYFSERHYRYEIFLRLVPDSDAGLKVSLENIFLGVRPEEAGPQDSRALQLQNFGDGFHSHPSILELGILLLEIQYGQSIRHLSIQQRARLPSEEEGWDNDLIAAWRVLDDPAFDKSLGKGRAAAIRACLRCDFFPACRTLELEKLMSDDEIVELSDSENEELEPIGSETQIRDPIQFMSIPTDGSPKWRVFDEEVFSEEQKRSADAWVQHLTEFLDRIMHPLLEGERFKCPDDTRTKIAILDTGIDIRNGYIRSQLSRIKEKRNWVSEKGSVDLDDIADSFGHGTHVTGLSLRTAPCADVCIGRVASGKLLENGETYVAEAIVWASETCKANMIIMSFGFPRSSDIVEEAIIRAHAAGTIMFAATRNDGGNKAVAYPANHHNVIGIASSDGMGNGSKFNPSPPEDDASFFSTLGEAVESSWPRLPYNDEHGNPAVTGSKRRKSGTSFATPIAAALAANILDYARLELDMGEKYLKRLHTFGKMVAVLKLMAPEKRTGYRYLVPWLQWWTADEYATQEELEIEKTRIRTDILKVLMK